MNGQIERNFASTSTKLCVMKPKGFVTKQTPLATKQKGFVTKQTRLTTKQKGFITKQTRLTTEKINS